MNNDIINPLLDISSSGFFILLYNDCNKLGTSDSSVLMYPIVYQSGEYGYIDYNDDFQSFSSGGTDVSDTTATAATVLNGYYFYLASGEKTQGTYIPLDTSDATAGSGNIESGYTAYVNGVKITGSGVMLHGIFKYTGSVQNLSTARMYLAAASNPSYAIFAGGYTGSGVKTVDAYNTSLSRSSAPQLLTETYTATGNSIGNYALVAGGQSFNSNVEAYNTSLSKSCMALAYGRPNPAGSNNQNYAIYGGGMNGSYVYVEAFDSTLNRTLAPNFATNKYNVAATNLSNTYVLFAGGESQNYNAYRNTVEVYNNSLTKSTPTGLSSARTNLAGASNPNYALFSGGHLYSDYTPVTTIDIYNSSLSRSNTISLSTGRVRHMGASLDKYAVFLGYTIDVEGFDENLTRSINAEMSYKVYSSVTTLSQYIILGGGQLIEDSTRTDFVDVFFAS